MWGWPQYWNETSNPPAACPSIQRAGRVSRAAGSGRFASQRRLLLQSIQQQQKPGTRKPGSSWAGPDTLVSLLHTPNRLEIHCKTQHILDDSLTLVKFSSKISLWWSLLPLTELPFPSADNCLLLLLKVTPPHLLHCWAALKLLYLQEMAFLLNS